MSPEIEQRLRDAAGRLPAHPAPALRRAGDVAEVVYATVDSPFGALTVAGTRTGVVRVAYPDQTPDDIAVELATLLTPSVVHAPARLDDVRRQLDEYFAGDRRRFEMTIDWRLAREGFTRRVLRATARIPFGAVRTYTEMAASAGSPKAARAAGNALGSNPVPIVVPCHRVVHAGGGLGGYTGGVERKEYLLGLEGLR